MAIINYFLTISCEGINFALIDVAVDITKILDVCRHIVRNSFADQPFNIFFIMNGILEILYSVKSATRLRRFSIWQKFYLFFFRLPRAMLRPCNKCCSRRQLSMANERWLRQRHVWNNGLCPVLFLFHVRLPDHIKHLYGNRLKELFSSSLGKPARSHHFNKGRPAVRYYG